MFLRFTIVVILIFSAALFSGCQKDTGGQGSSSPVDINQAGGGSPVESNQAGGSGNGQFDDSSDGQIGSSSDGVQAGGSGQDKIIGDLFANKESNVQVKGAGTVTRLLPDDEEGDRHQRFILELASGQTLLVAHNIDIAPRLDGLALGDTVAFYGEYVYTDKGGTIHWTHHDPGGRHVSGWLKWDGGKYQ